MSTNLENAERAEMTMTPHAYAQEYEFRGDTDYTPSDFERTMIEDAICGYLGEIEDCRAALSAPADTDAAQSLIKPRGGLEPIWWEVSMILRSELMALRKAAQKVVDETDAIHDSEPSPTKYRAPYGAITELRAALRAGEAGK